MDMKRRLTVVIALAAVGTLASACVALANNSTLSFKFCKGISNCNTVLPGAPFKSGSLTIHTHTTYSPNATTHRVRLYFDRNFKFNNNNYPKCNPAAIAGNITMKQAMTACGSALVGKGTALADASSPGDSHACVLAFNKTGAGIALFIRAQVIGAINCASPATNTNGNVTILLQAPFANNPAATAPGGALNAAYYAPPGRFLDFNNIDASSPLNLSDINVKIDRGATAVTGYVQASCTNRVGLGPPAKKWVMRGVFNYIGGAPLAQAVNKKNGPPVGCT